MAQEAAAAAVARHPFAEAEGGNVVVRNGVVDPALSNLSRLPAGVFVGRLADAAEGTAAHLVRPSGLYSEYCVLRRSQRKRLRLMQPSHASTSGM